MMNVISRFLVVSILVLLNVAPSRAQGCSDAGACSIESLSPAASSLEKKNELSIGLNAGAADHNIFVLGAQIAYSRKIGTSFSLDGKLTYASLSNNEHSEGGLGDVFLIANYKPSEIFTISGGVKIPTHKASEPADFIYDLPMDFQSSLGTIDLIVGLACQKNNWLFGLGYQQPLSQNENKFAPFYWEGRLNDFHITQGYQRKPDLLLRMARIFPLTEKLTVVAGLLPIYHVGEDTFLGFDGNTHNIEGSAGLTLNATGHFILKAGDKNKFGFNIGFPIVVREARPDGLTRSFVAGVEYAYSF
jgi:hypothetical protein